MLRWLVRVMGLLLLAGAFAAAVIDGARSLANQQLSLTPTGVALATAFPSKFEAATGLIRAKLPGYVWDPILLSTLYVPTFVALGVLGLILMTFARSKRPRDSRR